MLEVVTYDGRRIGTIRQTEGNALISSPPHLNVLTKRFLEQGFDATQTYRALDGWSNGYLKVKEAE